TAVRNSELLRYSELNAQLHGAIRDVAAHETASRLLRQLRDQTVRYQFSLSLVPGRPAVSLPQHESIVAAVTAQDPEEAEAAMRRHLESVLAAYRALSRAVSTPRGNRNPANPGMACRSAVDRSESVRALRLQVTLDLARRFE